MKERMRRMKERERNSDEEAAFVRVREKEGEMCVDEFLWHPPGCRGEVK